MHRNDVMTPEHPLWPRFIEALDKAPICEKSMHHSRRVLESMPGVDVSRSLETLAALGACCDCEILFDLAGISKGVSA